nr:MAG TPA: hypothetical protein [Caudoviricetes sp.]
MNSEYSILNENFLIVLTCYKNVLNLLNMIYEY